jgi:hypothetical protein
VSDPQPPPRPSFWHRRRGLLIVGTIVVVAAVSVLSDLPVSSSRANDISAERSVMTEVNTDLGPCALAVNQAIGIWNLQAAHRLTPGDRSGTPGLLSDDQAACSFTNESIYDLTNIDVPGSPAGRLIGQLVATATLWTTSDALRAIEDVQSLMEDPGDAAALRSLSKSEGQLAKDRGRALSEEDAADRILDVRLPPADLPALPGGGG